MARGKTSSKNANQSNAWSALNKMNAMQNAQNQNSFQQMCKSTLENLVAEASDTTLHNVAERFTKLFNDMTKIQDAFKKRSKFDDFEHNILPKYANQDERLAKCNKLLEEIKDKYDLVNLDHVKIIKEFEGVGLRKCHTKESAKEFLHDKEKNMIRIPVKAMFTSNTEVKNIDFERMLRTDRMAGNMANIRLALRLLYHKYADKQSDYKTWLDTLPANYSTPLFWTPNDFEYFQKGFEAVHDDILGAYKLYTTIARQYLYFLTVLSNIKSCAKFTTCFTWDAYRWAVATVQTRANGLEKDQKILGFIPIVELANTNLKSQLSINRVFEEKSVKLADGKEKKINKITMAELDISSIGNNKNIYFSYTANNRRNAFESLIYNDLCFRERMDVVVNLPQAQPLHRSKTDYMLAVGGTDYDINAPLSPLVMVSGDTEKKVRLQKFEQLISFLNVALDDVPESMNDYDSPIIKETERQEAFKKQRQQKLLKKRKVEYAKAQAAQKEGKEYKPPVLTEEEKQAEKEKYEQEEKEFNDNAIAQYPADFYPYKHVNPEIRAKSIQFLKIRLGVIVAYLSKIELEKFDTPIVKNFLSYKIEMYKELKELANEL